MIYQFGSDVDRSASYVGGTGTAGCAVNPLKLVLVPALPKLLDLGV